jgi:biopolymer transport protein ExbB
MSLISSLKARGTAMLVVLVVAVLMVGGGAAFAADPTASGSVPGAAAPADTAAPAAPAAAPVATDVGGVTVQQNKKVVDNPYGLDALWAQGDFVSRGTLTILVIMSAFTWYVMITKLIEQTMIGVKGKAANRTFWRSNSVSDGLKTLAKSSPFYFMVANGLDAVEHHEGTMVEKIDLSTWVNMSCARSLEQIVGRLQSGMAVLATVGSTAPFVGLFGTVWGIYHALTAIGIAGQASIDKVAGPVGEALIMTAFGLAVAVPAVLGYNWLIRRNKTAIETVRNFNNDLHSVLMAGMANRARG